MAVRAAVVSALLGAVHLVQASPAYGHGYGNPYGGNDTTKGVVYTTEVVTAVTTYCPYATTLTYGDNTYTVTEPTTLTITDCPCTISKPVKPTTTPGVVYTTEVVTAVTTYCPYATTLTYGDHTYTVTEPTTLTITDCPCTISKPVKPTSQPVYTKPVYYTKEVLTAITTYCSEATTLSFNNKTYSVTGPTTLTITDCPCTIHKPVYSQPAGKDCPEECYNAYNYCRGLADANMATCASQYSNCLGYNPFGSDGSIIKPTACSHQPAVPTNNVPVNPTGPAKNYGTAPAGGETATATGPVTVPTGAAGRLSPGYVLAALGAAVLL